MASPRSRLGVLMLAAVVAASPAARAQTPGTAPSKLVLPQTDRYPTDIAHPPAPAPAPAPGRSGTRDGPPIGQGAGASPVPNQRGGDASRVPNQQGGDASRVPNQQGGGQAPAGSSRRNNAVPAAVVGAVALIAIGSLLASERSAAGQTQQPPPDEMASRLLNDGPMLAPAFNMSAFAVRGFVRGGWPMLIDFQQRSAGRAALRISARDLAEVFTYELSPLCPAPRRCVVQIRLPPEVFGDQLRPAVIAIAATDSSGGQTLPEFDVYALGAGPRAIGSVAIDQVSFGPATIRVAENERALYRFFSHSEFGHAAVEFWRVERDSDGNRLAFVLDRTVEGGLQRKQWVGMNERREWDGTEKERKVSPGVHKIQVRAWDRVGDWLTSWSNSTVTVER